MDVLCDILVRPFDLTGCSEDDYDACLSGETNWKYCILSHFSFPEIDVGRTVNDFLIYICQDDIYEIMSSTYMLRQWYEHAFEIGLRCVEPGDAVLGEAMYEVFKKTFMTQEETDGHGLNETLIKGLGDMGYTLVAEDVAEYLLATITPEHFWVIRSGFESLFALDADVGLETAMTMLSRGGYNDAPILSQIMLEQKVEITKEQMLMVIERDVNEQTTVLALEMLRHYGDGMLDERFAAYLEQKLIDPNERMRFEAARMLFVDYEKDIDTFKEYFDNHQLDIIAGAYGVAYGYVDDSVLIDALLAHGDKEMAEYFLYTFSDAVEQWADENGYMIVESTIK